MNCPECGFRLTEGMRFCGQCGTKLSSGPQVVPSPDKTFTNERSLISQYLPTHLSDKIISSGRKIEGERRQVTALGDAVTLNRLGIARKDYYEGGLRAF